MEQNRTQGSSPRLIATLAALGACAGIAMAPAASAGDGSVKTNDARSEKAVKLTSPDTRSVKLDPADSKTVKLAPADSKTVKLNPADANAVKLDPASQKVAPGK